MTKYFRLAALIGIISVYGLCAELRADESGSINPYASVMACASEENDIARLQCFDQAVATLETEADPAAADALDLDEAAPSQDQPVIQPPKRRMPTNPESIQEADERMVESCEFLGNVLGKSGWGGVAARSANRGALRSAKKRAAKLGATHIVIAGFDNGSGITLKASTMQARAYACDGEED